MMKIYTRHGDDGSTGLFGGQRVRKDDPRIECYGTVDELNASLGLAAATLAENLREVLGPRLIAVQNELFVIGACLATPVDRRAGAKLPPLEMTAVQRLETEIDAADAELPPLRNFILPGGSQAAAQLHQARTICRRAERLLVKLHDQTDPQYPVLLTYLNRLSDWLFVQARWVNRRLGFNDVEWAKQP
jgi:cob(I)alamin adenosyltransferase